MQQANVTCIRVYVDMQTLALMQVTFACCIMHSNGACACPDPLLLALVGIFYQQLYIWHDLLHNEMH